MKFGLPRSIIYGSNQLLKKLLREAIQTYLESWQTAGLPAAQNQHESLSFDHGRDAQGLSRSREQYFTLYGDVQCCFYVGRSKDYMPKVLFASIAYWVIRGI
ncbi:hypothetical protein V6Z11_D10G171900 [Gossypium hirsutum]